MDEIDALILSALRGAGWYVGACMRRDGVVTVRVKPAPHEWYLANQPNPLRLLSVGSRSVFLSEHVTRSSTRISNT